ncbi:MAG: Crp/Fnr family transcriptional regulator [Bacteroidota bacterium]
MSHDFSNLVSNIRRYVELNSDDENEFVRIVTTSRVKKRQFIVQPRFVCRHQTYVVRGALRSYFVTDSGEDHTIQFAIDDWFISDFNSYISQTPASLYVEVLEDSLIQQIEYNDVENLCLSNPKFERYFRLVSQKAFAFSQKRILSNLNKTAEERYLEFQSSYPAIVEKVPQYALASFRAFYFNGPSGYAN